MLIRLMLVAVLLSSCSPGEPDGYGSFLGPGPGVSEYPDPPTVAEGSLPSGVAGELDALMASIMADDFDDEALIGVAAGGDVRVAWFLADLMRFYQRGRGSGPPSWPGHSRR